MLSNHIAYETSANPLELEDISVLYGANYFSGGPVVRCRVNLKEYDEVFTNKIPDFFSRLEKTLPSLVEHHCSPGVYGGFFQRVKKGTLLGHVMEHTIIELLYLAGMNVGFGKTRMTKIQGVYNVVFRFSDEIAGVYAAKAGLNLLNAILLNQDFDVEEVVKKLVAIREERLLGPSTQAIVDEANRRRIPVMRLNQFNQVQLGTGKYRKVIRATITDDSSLIGVETTDDKYLTSDILYEAGVPIPQRTISTSLDKLLEFFKQMDKPLVLKPAFGRRGKGVSTQLRTMESVKTAFDRAKQFSKEVIAQEFVPGNLYRVLIIDYKFVAAVQLVPPHITGNGKNTVSELVAKLNQQPGREIGDKGKLSVVKIDEDTKHILALKGYDINSILPQNETLYLKNTGSTRLGAESIDVTTEVAEYNKFMVERITKILKLNVAGIDIISDDIHLPFSHNDAKIIEVNAAPDLKVHFNPTVGTKRNVQRHFVDMMFPGNRPTHVPLYSVTGSKGKDVAVQILDFCFRHKNIKNGVISKRGLSVSGNKLKNGDCTDSENVHIILKDPTIDCAIIETPVENILKNGIGYEYADFGIVLNMDENIEKYYEYDHIRDADDVAYAKSVVAEQVFEKGYTILNADDELVLQMRDRVYSQLVLFATNPKNEDLLQHIEEEKTAAFFDENDMLCICEKGNITRIMHKSDILLLQKKKEKYIADCVLSTAVAMFLSEVPVNEIGEVFHHFEFSFL